MYQARSVSRPDRTPPVASAIRSLVILIALVLSSCAIQLSPAYNQATFTSISDLNVKTETLMASLSQGGTAGDFAKYKATYDQLIGGFSAARMETASRDVPAPSQRVLKIAHLNSVCGNDPTNCVNPTPHHLDQVIKVLTKMRDIHQSGELKGNFVTGSNGIGGFKYQYEIEMSRILVFESALQR
ncbi:hypothetical protein [Mesorhizobium sp. B1-1-8]|uniref:hypothetical protein n=1 Tax=Mesorhizobium sp. B1-1-8 TaxID=2589976 RepID=UPI00112E0951|nr:hypothetical protein [Mesorhizobium sp. B1-1-8]UCI07378.1 hypothetical protein FJ974_26940 [Mesorhizobium sp. B1-1-8]